MSRLLTLFARRGGPLAETAAWAAAVAARGYTPDAQLVADIDAMIAALKADGTWGKLDVLIPLAVPDALAAVCVVNPARVTTPTSGPTFTADRGFTGNGSNSYVALSPTYVPSAGGYHFTLNAAHLGVYTLTDSTTGNYHWGEQGAGFAKVRARPNTGSGTSVNTGTATTASGSQALPAHVIGVRPDASTQKLYRNGVSNATASVASASLPGQMSILRVAGNYSDAQVALVHAGGALTDAEALTLHNAVNGYLQARGAV